MYPIENVIRNAVRKETDKLDILVLNEGQEDYIETLCRTGHNFYLIEGVYPIQQWPKKYRPQNLSVEHVAFEKGTRTFDLMICFNRANLFDKAFEISHSLHIPLIVVDTVSSLTKIPIPFLAKANIKSPESLFHKNGVISVGLNSYITKSWSSPYQGMGIAIDYPAEKYEIAEGASKILIDDALPQEYIDNLPIHIDDRFTAEPSEACIYFHLWENITTKMMRCMASRIPVVTLKSQDFTQIIEAESCILIENIRQAADQSFVDGILGFEKTEDIVSNAKSFITNDEKGFLDKWETIFRIACDGCYTRG